MPRLATAFLLSSLTSVIAAQQLLVPDSQNFVNSGTTTAAWPTSALGGRVQWCYDTTHFTNAGVTGPITINRLRFRAADGSRSLGGQVFTGVIVQLGNAALDHAALSTTYALNQGTMGPASVPMMITMAPVSGAVPNDYVVDIDLVANGASFIYNPTLGNDLLIDFTFTVGALPATNLVSQATSSVIGQRGRRCAGTLAGPGALSAFAAAIMIDFAGPGGYTAPSGSHVEAVGHPCNTSAQSFYQAFGTEPFDLRGSPNKSLLLTPDSSVAPTKYTVTAGSTPVDFSPTALGLGLPDISDEGVITVTPGFTYNFPGGSTTTFSAAANGYVWLGTNVLSDFSPTVLEVTNQMARMMPYWNDHHGGRNVLTHPGCGMYINTDLSGGPGNGVTYVTWKDVGEFAGPTTIGGVSVNNFQCVLFENGNCEFRYGSMTGWLRGSGITGFSRGGTVALPAADSGSRDLSVEVPFMTVAEGAAGSLPLRLTVNLRASLGVPTAVNQIHTISNMPAATTAQAYIFYSFAQQAPAGLLPLAAPGCELSLGPTPALWSSSVVLPGATFTDTGVLLPLGTSPIAGGFMGMVYYTQGVTLDWDGFVFTLKSTNTLRHTLGLL